MPARSRTLILVLLASPLPAQATEQGEDRSRAIGEAVERMLMLECETRLASADLATIAWGAWLVARHRLDAAVPKVKQVLASLPEGPDRRFAALNLLDALQVNGARPTHAELAGFDSGIHEAVAFVLLARSPKQNADYFRAQFDKFDHKGRPSRWHASGNLLAGIADRRFARTLVHSLAYELEVVVSDGNVGGGAGGAAGGRFGDGRVTVPSGFPPLPAYSLTTAPRSGDVLFAPGDPAVYFRRVVKTGRKVGLGGREPMEPFRRQRRRVRWIGAMLRNSWLELPREHSAWIRWKGADAFVTEVENARESLAKKHSDLVARTVKAGWFAAREQRGLTARILVRVSDQRRDKSVALPKIQ